MGMFDEIRCKYPLPIPEAQDLLFQTKDTEEIATLYMEQYEIREDGTLWVEDYDTEDHSKKAQWIRDNPGKEVPEMGPLDEFIGCMTRVNKRWRQIEDFTGEIRFYSTLNGNWKTGWVEFSAYFVNGKVKDLNVITKPQPSEVPK